MSKIVTQEEFVNRVHEVNPLIEILGDYVKAKEGVECRCLKCGHVWNPTPSNLYKGRGCPKCAGHYQRTQEEFVAEVARVNPNVKVLGTYIDMHTRIEAQCCQCGHVWSPIAQSLIEGYGCRKCSYDVITSKTRLSHEEIVLRMKEKHPDIEIIGKYKNWDTPVECHCNICGYDWSPRGWSLQQQKGCPKCTNQISRTHEEFLDEMARISPTIKIIGGEFELRNKSRLKCECTVCGRKWEASANNLLNGVGCKECVRRKQTEAQRKSHEQFVSEMREINPNIEILSEYVSQSYRVQCKCSLCGHTWQAWPQTLLNGHGCSNCNHTSTSVLEQLIAESFIYQFGEKSIIKRDKNLIGMELDIIVPQLKLAIEPGSWFWHMDKVDKDEEKRKLCQERGIRLITIYDSFEGDYNKNSFGKDCYVYDIDLGLEKHHNTIRNLLKHIFEEYGQEFNIDDEEWRGLENKAYIKSRKITTADFIDLVANINEDIIVLGEYRASNKGILCRCRKCGYEWSPTPSALLNSKSGCHRCRGGVKISHEEFVNRLHAINPDIEVLGEYTNTITKIKVRCKKCDSVFYKKPNSLISGVGCNKCSFQHSAEIQRMTHNEFLKKMELHGQDNIEVLGKYINYKTHILCRCKTCGKEWMAPPSSLLKGHGCSKCTWSKKKDK